MHRTPHFPTNGPRRILAFLIEIIPICCAVTFVCKAALGMTPLLVYDETLHQDVRVAGYWADGYILSYSFITWVVYCAILECSPMAASYGKKALGLKVCDLHGRRPGCIRALARNTCKIFSAFPFFLGFFWALFSTHGRTWHDQMTGTVVREK